MMRTRRNIGILVVVLIAVATSIMVVQRSGQRGEFTMEDISRRIKAEKAEFKADLAAQGKAYEPGLFPSGWGHTQRAYPYDRINFDQLKEAVVDAQAMRLEARRGFAPLSATWVEEGPSNIGARITELAMHPTNPDIIFAAHASGGVHKSTDAGVTWTPITDDLPVLTIGAIALDPTDPDIIYVGTGEANAHSFSWFGMGMYKSTDGGSSWSYIGLEETRYIGRIVVDPLNPSRLWVAGTGSLFGTDSYRGVYRSLDGGMTWENKLSVTDSTSAIDIVIDPAKPDTIFAAMWERVRGLTYRQSGGWTSGIWRSYDGGDTWTELTSGLPKGYDVGRIGLSLCASNPSVIYAIYDMWQAYEVQVYKSTNGGDYWSRTNDGALEDIHSSFGWYFGQIRVDPSNSDRVFAMGVPFYRSENGGSSWSEVGSSNHVDHHAMVFDPTDNSNIYEGNDGGIYFSTNSGSSWTKLYNQPTNQFYAIEIDYLNPQRLYGGTQDNGTLRTPTGGVSDWEPIFGGDGFYCNVDPTDSDVIYVEYQFGNLYKTTDFGGSWDWAMDGIDNSRTNWSTPVVMDPADNQTLYYGSYRVYKTTDGANWWNAISGDLTGGNHGGGFGTITTIAVSPTDSDVLYVGTDDSNVWVTQNGGSSWTDVSSSLPNRWVTRVAIDPVNPAIAYVSFSGLRWNENIGYVYRTTDYGATWTDITGNLPGAPVNVVIVDPGNAGRLFVGSDVGCFYSENLGTSWQLLGVGLPAVPVFDIKIHNPTRTLVAGTHGRSMHSFDLSSFAGIKDREPVRTIEMANHPNPFSESTTLRFALSVPSEVSLKVYDLAGREVRTLESGDFGIGDHGVRWDGKNDEGRRVAAGVYFASLRTGQGVATTRLNLIR
jgi:photosystem II stability/assembly factor-like uncharacterized protein